MKSVLIIGLDPALINFSDPDYKDFPGLNAEKVMSGLEMGRKSLLDINLNAEICLIDFGETAESVILKRLNEKSFDCILIGAGVRATKGNFILFEKLINIIHEHAPKAKICFNTNPNDTTEAVKRWL